MAGCRDCVICTRPALIRLFYLPFRLVYAIVFGILWHPFRKKCPQCGHPIAKHKMRADGSFKD